MPLHPQAQAIITGVEAMGLPPLETLSVDEARAAIQGLRSFMIPSEDVGSVVDTIAPGPEVDVPLRIYLPAEEPGEAKDDDDGLRPGIFYFHGGGFTTGSIDLVDPICRRLANRSGCGVISVDYRLAPEHPYPAAVTDAYIAIVWMAAKGAAFGIDRDRLAVMGDSAGANLAAVMCMTFRDKIEDDVRIAVQVLLAPWTDLAPIDSESRREYGQGYLLTNGLIEWFAGHYLGGDPRQVEEPYCSPLRAADLSGLPPAIIVTAEYDPLRDEGEAYGAMLRQDRVWTDIRRQEGMIHSFYWMGGAIDRGREIIDELAAEFRSEFRL